MADPSLLGIAAPGLAAAVALAALTWAVSVWRRDASLVDRTWPLLIAVAAFSHLRALPAADARSLAAAALLALWALRLAAYITWRNWGEGEDRRYREIRARNEPHFALKSLVIVFGLQALLAWIVSAPFLALAWAGAAGAPAPLNLLDLAGLALAASGTLFEAVADAQMARFKAQPANRGRVMDRGLWHYTRHPNYFGECCVWWGFFLVALGGAGLAGAASVLSPLLMTVLLLKVSGVSLLEKDIGERRPAYRDYVARTNAFVPGPPRKGAA